MIQNDWSAWPPIAFQIWVRRTLAPLAAIASLTAIGVSTCSGAAIVAGNLVIYRVGDGSAAPGTAATAVFLDEYTPTGTFVQSIPVATSGTSALTAVGNATSEGIMSLSQDGTLLVFTGYRKDVGSSDPSVDLPGTTNRVIATVGLSGVVNTSVALTDTNGIIRSATTVDGSSFYIGTSTALRHIPAPGPASTSVAIDARNSRQVNLRGDVLYASNGSGAVTAKVQSYGMLPTGPTSPSALVNLDAADVVNSFAIFDLNPAVPGDDTIYIANVLGNTIGKYTFDGFTWNASGSLTITNPFNVTGVLDGGNVNLYLIDGPRLYSFTDTTGYGGTLFGSPTAIATASINTAFRGVNLIPVPEPSAAGLIGFAAMSGLGIRRKRCAPNH